MARRRKAKKSPSKKRCKGLNSRTGKLKKGWKWPKRSGRCPVKARKSSK